MPISSVALTVTAPARSATGGYLETATLRAQRAWLAARHAVGLNMVKGYTGLSDLTGYTTVTVTTADGLRTELASGTPTTKKRILCQWNGSSAPSSAATIVGPATGTLTVDGGSDTGYAHPDGHAYRIEADTGYTPTIGVSGTTSLSLTGFGWLDIRGLTFTGTLRLTRAATNPLRTRAALSGNTLNSVLEVGSASEGVGGLETLHIAGNTFDGAGVAMPMRARTHRVWSNVFKSKDKDGDLATVTGLTNAVNFTDWDVDVWWAGNLLYDTDHLTTSVNHFDTMQYNVGTEVINSMNLLYEFNLMDADIPASQGLFCDDGGTTIRHSLIHNNMLSIRASYAIAAIDASGAGWTTVHRNTIAPAATIDGFDGGGGFVHLMPSNEAITAGRWEVSRNVLVSKSVDAGLSGFVIDLANYAYVKPTGSGNSWNSNFAGQLALTGGFWQHERLGDGQTPAQAKAAIGTFMEPVGGYASSAHGMRDPAGFPTDFTAAVT